MLGWLRTLILYRLLGGRALLAVAAAGWLWRRVSGRSARENDRGTASAASASRGRAR